MKINELLSDFYIFTTNEEKDLLEKIPDYSTSYHNYNEREKTLIDNLIKKSILVKINENDFAFKIKKNKENCY